METPSSDTADPTNNNTMSVAPDNLSITPENLSIAPDNRSIAPENRSIAPENRSIAPDTPNVAPDTPNVAPDTLTVAPDDESGVETESNCSYEETAAKIEHALRKSLNLSEESEETNGHWSVDDILQDVSQLEGYQEPPRDCPVWKRSLIEKKNQEILDKARSELVNQRQEEDKWRDIPQWKRNLIKEKEKRKNDELAPLEAERRKREEERSRLQSMPEWKRNLILSKRSDM